MNKNEQEFDEDNGETLLRMYLKHPDKFIGIDKESPLYNHNKNESKPSLTKLQGLLDRPQSGDANRHASAPGKVSLSKDCAVRTTFRRKESTKSSALRSLSPLSTSASTDSDVTKWLTAGSGGSARETEKTQLRKAFQTRPPSSPAMVDRKANAATISLESSSIDDGTRRIFTRRVVNKNLQRRSPPRVSRGETARGQTGTDYSTSGRNTEINNQVPVPNIRCSSATEKTHYSLTGARDRCNSGNVPQENKIGTWDSKKEEVVFLKKDQRDLRTSDSESDVSKVSNGRTKARKPTIRSVEGPSSKFEANVTRRHGSVNISVAAGEQCKRQIDKQIRQTHAQVSKPPWGARQPPFR